MTCKKIFLMIIISLASTQCSDFKDVFNSGDQTQTSPSKTQKISKADSTQSEDVKSEEPQIEQDGNSREAITTKEGTYYFIKEGDTLSSVASQYKVSGIALAHVNDMLYESTLPVGRRIFIPNKKKLSKYVDRKLLRNSLAKTDDDKNKAKPKTPTSVGFVWPTKTGEVTSQFGMRHGKPHDGIDIGIPSGTPVFSVADGEVLFAEYFSSYGKLILIKHKNGLFSAYAHNRKFLVSKGQKVKQGQQISESGKTGRATGPHLHFEVHRKGGVKLDPLTVLPPKK